MITIITGGGYDSGNGSGGGDNGGISNDSEHRGRCGNNVGGSNPGRTQTSSTI